MPPEIVVLDSTNQPGAICVVCGQPIEAGAGVTASFRGRILRFRCPGCLARFVVDSDHYPAEGPPSCCEGDQGHEVPEPFGVAAASEWAL